MTRSFARRFTRSLVAASIVALSACSSPGTNAGTNAGITPLTASHSSVTAAPFGRSPKATLYVSDSGTDEVDLFGWPKPEEITKTLTGFSEPQGMCADQLGDVFITNTGDSNILEYDGSKLINTLFDPNEYPVGCSYDTLHGDLAVSNMMGTNDRAGSVAIYKNAAGAPKLFFGQSLQHVFSVQYDGSGDLYAYGQNSSYQFALSELRSGAKKFKAVCPQLMSSVEILGIGWDGRHLIFEVGTGVDRIENCEVVGFTRLLGPPGVYVLGHQLIAMSSNEVAVYDYPKGGFPVRTFTLSDLSEPIGFAISEHAKGK
jgi:hypothetical protein